MASGTERACWGHWTNGHLDLYYVDFGTEARRGAPEALRHLRSDFLSLPFQAIECSLAGIVPSGDAWAEAALDEFERLTHCARWRPLVARIRNYSAARPGLQLLTRHRGQGSVVVAARVAGAAGPCRGGSAPAPRGGHRVFRLLRDGKHASRGDMELLLTRSVQDLGSRGDVVSVRKQLGRNKLLPQGLAVYPSPENIRKFQEEKETLEFLRRCRLRVGMKNNVRWELSPDVVARHFLKNFMRPKTRRFRHWQEQQRQQLESSRERLL
ncbi:hypothetical protein DUI87_29678 [Hirundo rustica rustica]|uniref:Large ribosomal subunit protein bL9m n=1 Tax=Hirundo rustica rustica TaxID=333673 RepID=A0A3M0IZR6_HIRRU|nr:hypothetical protein DUI87_29678 [Hirundo rustica rustica]